MYPVHTGIECEYRNSSTVAASIAIHVYTYTRAHYRRDVLGTRPAMHDTCTSTGIAIPHVLQYRYHVPVARTGTMPDGHTDSLPVGSRYCNSMLSKYCQ